MKRVIKMELQYDHLINICQNILKKQKGFTLTASELYRTLLQRTDKTISKSTFYNTLSIMLDRNIVIKRTEQNTNKNLPKVYYILKGVNHE